MQKFMTAALVAGICLIGVDAGTAHAQGLKLGRSSSSGRSAQFQRQTRLMDTRLSGQYRESSRLRPGASKQSVTIPLAANIPAYTGRKSQFQGSARAAARQHGIPEDLFLRLIQQESGWNPRAVSNKGARGLAQLMPGTAAQLGVNASDPVQNLQGGARYLRLMYNKFGNWRLALAAYNAGPGAVVKHGGIPPYRETRNYVRIIHGS